MRKAMVLGLLALAGTLASPAFADDQTGWRMGMNLSSDKLEGTFSYLNGGISYGESINTQRFGYGLFGGWALNKYLAVEAGFNSGAGYNQEAFHSAILAGNFGTGNGNEVFNTNTDLKAFTGSLVGSVWIGNKFSLFGRVGFYAWKSEVTWSLNDPDAQAPITGNAHDTGYAPMFGGGIQTKLDGALVRLEYTYSDLGDLAFGPGFGQLDDVVSALNFSIVWNLH